jgi:homoserine dehydrogenase
MRIGLLGCGTVGSAFVQLLARQASAIRARTGLEFEVTRIAVRDLAKAREVNLPDEAFTTDAAGVAVDPDVDVIVELIGGIDPARELLLDAIKAGKPVVTGNKELLATHGAEIFAAGDEFGVDVLFEAAVAGGVPLVRPLRESLLGEPVGRVLGIVNGTTNYILTRMSEDGMPYGDALAEAQRLGFAEADPTADVDGFDAGAKIAIIASIAFGVDVIADNVSHEGISTIGVDDIGFASRKGFVIKLLAIAERFGDASDPEIGVRVHPVLLRTTHPLASVRDSFNAVFVQGAAVGELMFYGRGAGGDPTASAVLGDVVDAGANLGRGAHASIGHLGAARIRPLDQVESEYYVSIDTIDRPGVLAAVAGVFGAHGVSIESMEQEGRGDAARIVFITHLAREADVRTTVEELRGLDAVRRVNNVIRVLGDESGTS